jgi:predicted RNase H-like HicB family nuclease
MGQLVEWPEIVTEGKDLEDCRAMLRDALNEMILAYNELGKEIPSSNP